MSSKRLFTSVASLCVMAAVTHGQTTVVNPQQATRPQSPQNQATQGRPAAGQNLDQAIAGCLLLANEEQIALAKFADGKVKSEKVKEFARMLSDEHRKVADDLQTVAPQQAQLAKNLGERSTTSVTNRTGAAQQGGQQAQMFEMQRRTAEECLQLTKQTLEEAQGEDFDKAFVGSQVGAHIAMLAKLRGAEAFASPQLQPIIAETTSTIEKHLDHAKELCKSMDKDGGHEQHSNN